jgi:DNA processing protein
MQNAADVHAAFHLSYLTPLTPSDQHRLVAHYLSPSLALKAMPLDWLGRGLISRELLEKIADEWEKAARFADAEMKEADEKGVRVYLRHEADYPALLREIAVAPPIIYVLGQPLREEALPLAIVGSRRPTYYGEKVARQLTGELVDAGITTVSGLARGIDSRVHDETIRRGGATWAVLGSGLLNIYPRENKNLAERITSQGALISEFSLHTPPFQGHFPRRNRIIAGLCHGTVIVEGDEKSGSLITARLAAEEGREVFAVPGPISSRLSRGPHRLIQNGAALVTGAEDILNGLPDHVRARTKWKTTGIETENYPAEHAALMRELQSTALPREVLCERLNISGPVLAALILELELKGAVKSLPGGFVEKT